MGFHSLPEMTGFFSTALSEALLFFMQDRDTLGGRSLTEKEVVKSSRLICILSIPGRLISKAMRNGRIYRSIWLLTWKWRHGKMYGRPSLLMYCYKEYKQYHIQSSYCFRSGKVSGEILAWLEKDADLVLIKRIVDVSDITILEQLSLFFVCRCRI